MRSLRGISPNQARNLGVLLICLALSLSLAQAAFATTYYVGPSGSNSLSTNSSSPGSLSYAVANAPSASTVILENGTYNGSPNGFDVANSSVTFQAQNWHGAIIENTTSGALWTSNSSSVNNVVCQGLVFGPSTQLGFSGGPDGGTGWQFLDCVFTKNGGFEAGTNGLFLHCLFTDDYLNAFDNGSNNFTMRNSIVRRANRADGDIGDYIGDKCDGSDYNPDSPVTGMTFDGVEFYDCKGAALWFDTNCVNWTIENCTFFANHGGNYWYDYGSVTGGTTTSFTNTGQSNLANNTRIIGTTGGNFGHATVVQSSSYNSQTNTTTYIVSPALPVEPVYGDHFGLQADGIGTGNGATFEADPGGSFINNVIYRNSDDGVYDHRSGDGFGLTQSQYYLYFTGNTFAEDGIEFFVDSQGNGGNNPSRGLGPTYVNNNNFKFASSALANWGSPDSGMPSSYGINFDYNNYSPDNSGENWLQWYWNPNGGESYAGSIAQAQSVFGYESHGTANSISFPAANSVSTAEWPAASDTSWSDIFFPADPSQASTSSDHQVNDDETTYIQNDVGGHHIGDAVTLTVFGHTRAVQNGSTWQTDVFDYSGGYVTVTMNSATAIDSIVPPYAQLTACGLPVTLTSVGPYGITATYGGGGSGGLLSGSNAGASGTYNLTSLGTSDWRQWGDSGGSNHKSSGGSQISDVNPIGGGNYGTWNSFSNETWSDGTPTTSSSGDSNFIWCNDVTNAGWTFTAPADTTTRTLYVLWGGANGTTVKLNAHLSDGSAPDYTDTKQLSGGSGSTIYLETITYHAASASNSLTITLTNSTNSAQSVDLAAAWLTGGGVTGSLSGSEATASTSTYNLTSIGTTDWAHWGDSSFVHKSSGGSQISNVTQTSGGSFGTWHATTRNVGWTDGTPTGSNSDDQNYIWCNGTTGQGWTFTAPADTTTRTLNILAGGDGGTPYAAIKLNAHLSDGSAPDYTDTRTTTSSANLFLYTITYNAASSGKTLTITLTKNDTDSATSVDLDSAWLH